MNDKLTLTREFFVLQKGGIPEIDVESWSLTIGGSVKHLLHLAYADLERMPQFSEIATLECYDNPPRGDLIGTAKWTGVKVRTILDKAGMKGTAVKVLFHAADGCSASHNVEYAEGDDVILALRMNDEVLLREHGYPTRLVAPGKYGYKWTKWVTRIEVVDTDKKGYWESRGYSDEANR